MQVLHIDDDHVYRSLVDDLRTDAGHLVMEADDLAQGWAQIRSAEALAIICDRRLPDGDGLDLLRRLRAAGRQDRFILMTSMLTGALEAEALAAGADLAVEKMLSVDALEAFVNGMAGMPVVA